VLSVDGKTAIGEAGGLTQTVRVDFISDLRVGDYVMVHAGFAIQKMTEAAAVENFSYFQEALHAL
ncbi:MAG: HypC/HybG/HupF family hydrogenase formation chaperone, partial [Oscillibacter sp.]